MTMLRVRASDERGIAAAVVMVSMIFILSLLALVIDGGSMYAHRRAIVNATDAAALAAAQAYAGGTAVCGSSDGAAMSAADGTASANISSPTRIFYACPASGAGTVKVGYRATAAGLFSGDHEVSTSATAAWGATLGGPGLLPFQLDSTQVTGACGVPSPTTGTPCSFWYDANNASSQWGFLNLCSTDAAAHGFCPSSKVGWNVSPSTQCPNTGSIAAQVIANGFPYALTMSANPPTYVCIDSGFGPNQFAAISIGSLGLFPVAVPPPILRNGNPDKYSIVGFTALRILYVGKGNNPTTIAQCGPMPSWVKPPGSNAECIKMQWQGPVEVPGEICTGCTDFGVHAIKLQS